MILITRITVISNDGISSVNSIRLLGFNSIQDLFDRYKDAKLGVYRFNVYDTNKKKTYTDIQISDVITLSKTPENILGMLFFKDLFTNNINTITEIYITTISKAFWSISDYIDEVLNLGKVTGRFEDILQNVCGYDDICCINNISNNNAVSYYNVGKTNICCIYTEWKFEQLDTNGIFWSKGTTYSYSMCDIVTLYELVFDSIDSSIDLQYIFLRERNNNLYRLDYNNKVKVLLTKLKIAEG
jgi:hypothetical protein